MYEDWARKEAIPLEEYCNENDPDIWKETLNFYNQFSNLGSERLLETGVKLGGCGGYPFLYFICRCKKPQTVIETGVAYGLSSFYILSALNKNKFGTLTSIDAIFRPWQSEEMIGSIIPKYLRDKWKLVLGRSNEKLLDELKENKNIEIFIHDSLHTYKNMTFEFNCAMNNIKDDGIIISDDILDNDAFYNFIKNKEIKNSIIKVEDKGLGFIQKD